MSLAIAKLRGYGVVFQPIVGQRDIRLGKAKVTSPQCLEKSDIQQKKESYAVQIDDAAHASLWRSFC